VEHGTAREGVERLREDQDETERALPKTRTFRTAFSFIEELFS
jgi:hypothetical protein